MYFTHILVICRASVAGLCKAMSQTILVYTKTSFLKALKEPFPLQSLSNCFKSFPPDNTASRQGNEVAVHTQRGRRPVRGTSSLTCVTKDTAALMLVKVFVNCKVSLSNAQRALFNCSDETHNKSVL